MVKLSKGAMFKNPLRIKLKSDTSVSEKANNNKANKKDENLEPTLSEDEDDVSIASFSLRPCTNSTRCDTKRGRLPRRHDGNADDNHSSSDSFLKEEEDEEDEGSTAAKNSKDETSTYSTTEKDDTIVISKTSVFEYLRKMEKKESTRTFRTATTLEEDTEDDEIHASDHCRTLFQQAEHKAEAEAMATINSSFRSSLSNKSRTVKKVKKPNKANVIMDLPLTSPRQLKKKKKKKSVSVGSLGDPRISESKTKRKSSGTAEKTKNTRLSMPVDLPQSIRDLDDNDHELNQRQTTKMSTTKPKKRRSSVVSKRSTIPPTSRSSVESKGHPPKRFSSVGSNAIAHQPPRRKSGLGSKPKRFRSAGAKLSPLSNNGEHIFSPKTKNTIISSSVPSEGNLVPDTTATSVISDISQTPQNNAMRIVPSFVGENSDDDPDDRSITSPSSYIYVGSQQEPKKISDTTSAQREAFSPTLEEPLTDLAAAVDSNIPSTSSETDDAAEIQEPTTAATMNPPDAVSTAIIESPQANELYDDSVDLKGNAMDKVAATPHDTSESDEHQGELLLQEMLIIPRPKPESTELNYSLDLNHDVLQQVASPLKESQDMSPMSPSLPEANELHDSIELKENALEEVVARRPLPNATSSNKSEDPKAPHAKIPMSPRLTLAERRKRKQDTLDKLSRAFNDYESKLDEEIVSIHLRQDQQQPTEQLLLREETKLRKELQSLVKQLQEQLNKAKAEGEELAELKVTMEGQESKIKELQQENAHHEETIYSLRLAEKEMKLKILLGARAQGELLLLRSTVNSKMATTEELSTNLERVKQELNALREEVETLEDVKKVFSAEMERLTKELVRTKQELQAGTGGASTTSILPAAAASLWFPRSDPTKESSSWFSSSRSLEKSATPVVEPKSNRIKDIRELDIIDIVDKSDRPEFFQRATKLGILED